MKYINQEENICPFSYSGKPLRDLAEKDMPVRADLGDDAWSDTDDEEERHEAKKENPTRSERKKAPKSETPTLDKYGFDATEAALDGKLDPVIGREKEIERIAQILSRRKKNNPILIGEPGVGKTAIVEGLAIKIRKRDVPRVLLDKRIVMLDMTSVVAGSKYRGQFEERMQSLVEELRKSPDVILFIDEIHTLIGAGAAAGSLDAANILKPALARGDIQCIGATTLDEYRESIEKDGALDRRFQKVVVEATSPEDTLAILQNVKDRYEDHHNVSYTDEALKACVTLTDRYITDRFFPDKALDALDEAGARGHLTKIEVPAEITEIENRLAQLDTQKAMAAKAQNFELAASLRDQGYQLSAELEEQKKLWEDSLKTHRVKIDEDAVARVVSMMSGVPVQRIAKPEEQRLMQMESELNKKIVAQNDAISALTRAIRRSRVGLKDPNRPIGTFLFLGPTGVGKTYLAKQLALFLFGSEDALIRIDMSEYMEKFSVSRLVGAPPGYVGYEDGGQLTEKVRRKPYSIVLLDELEKAHPDTFNLLLQVMDEGRLTDSNGRTVDFKNTILIMTSNIGTRQLKEFGHSVGFTRQNRTEDKQYAREVIEKALHKQFSPEFLNRIDEVVTFNSLGGEDIQKIVEVELHPIVQRIKLLGYDLEVTDEAKKYLGKKGFDVQFGARPLKRSIQSHLEDAIAELLLSTTVPSGAKLQAEYHEGDERLTILVEKPKKPRSRKQLQETKKV